MNVLLWKDQQMLEICNKCFSLYNVIHLFVRQNKVDACAAKEYHYNKPNINAMGSTAKSIYNMKIL